MPVLLKRGAVLEFLIACLDFVASKCAKPVHPEFLTAETSHHRSVDYRTPQLFESDHAIFGNHARARQIADEAAGEAVARASRVEHVFEQIPGHHEVTAAMKHHGAIFAAFDYQDT